MKFKFLISLALILTIVISSCGTKDEELVAPKGMRYFDISNTGMNLNILIPDATVGMLDTAMKSWGAYEIKVGKNFQISIEEGDGDIEMVKADIGNDEVNKLKRYLIQEPTTLVWESGIADIKEFHFYHITKIGTRSYVIHNIKEEVFSQEVIAKMLEAAKQVKEIKKIQA